MASVPPKTTASGGISPRGCTRELTGLERLIRLNDSAHDYARASGIPKLGESRFCTRLVYLLDEKQLTKDYLWKSTADAGSI
jgi:hypothetical protein